MTSLAVWTLIGLAILAYEWWRMTETPETPDGEKPLDWDEWWNGE